jgi:hypothetical protein
MRSLPVLGWALFTAVAAGGQTAQPAQSTQTGALRSRLQTLAAAAELLNDHLPAFACHEALTSEELRKGKIKRRVEAAGELRVQPAEDGKLDESFEATEVDGKPHTGFFRAPIFVSGGFKNALGLFMPADQKCFAYKISGNRLDFRSPPFAEGEVCSQRTGISGFALFDDAGNLLHIEHTVQEEHALERNVVPHAELDVSPIDLGGTTYLLSTHVIAERPHDKSVFRWEATYSNCRLYQVTVKIGPATTVPEDSPK